jgi:hypothetical protein
MREGRTQTIGECLQREYRMVCHVIRGDFSRDLFEVIEYGHHQHYALYFLVIAQQSLYLTSNSHYRDAGLY